MTGSTKSLATTNQVTSSFSSSLARTTVISHNPVSISMRYSLMTIHYSQIQNCSSLQQSCKKSSMAFLSKMTDAHKSSVSRYTSSIKPETSTTTGSKTSSSIRELSTSALVSQNFTLSKYSISETASFFPVSPSSRLSVIVKRSSTSMDSSRAKYTDTVATSSNIKSSTTAADNITISVVQSLSSFIRERMSPTPVLHSTKTSRSNPNKKSFFTSSLLSTTAKRSGTFGGSSNAKSTDTVVSSSDKSGTTVSAKLTKSLPQSLSSFIRVESSRTPVLHSAKPSRSNPNKDTVLTVSLLSSTVERSDIFGDSSNAKSTDIVVSSVYSKSDTTASNKLTRSSAKTLSSFIREGSSSTPLLYSVKMSRSSPSKDSGLISSLSSTAAERSSTFGDSSNAKSTDIVVNSSDRSGTTVSIKLTKSLSQSLSSFIRVESSRTPVLHSAKPSRSNPNKDTVLTVSLLSSTVERSDIFGDSSNAKSTDIVVSSVYSKSDTTASNKLTRSSAKTLSSFIREGSSSTPLLYSVKTSRSSPSKDSGLTSSLSSTAAERSRIFGDSSNAKSTDMVVSSSSSKNGTAASDKVTRLLAQSLASSIRIRGSATPVLQSVKTSTSSPCKDSVLTSCLSSVKTSSIFGDFSNTKSTDITTISSDSGSEIIMSDKLTKSSSQKVSTFTKKGSNPTTVLHPKRTSISSLRMHSTLLPSFPFATAQRSNIFVDSSNAVSTDKVLRSSGSNSDTTASNKLIKSSAGILPKLTWKKSSPTPVFHSKTFVSSLSTHLTLPSSIRKSIPSKHSALPTSLLSATVKRSGIFGDSINTLSIDTMIIPSDSKSDTTASAKLTKPSTQNPSTFIKEGISNTPVFTSIKTFRSSPSMHAALPSSLIFINVKQSSVFVDSSNVKSANIAVASPNSKSNNIAPDILTKLSVKSLSRFTRKIISPTPVLLSLKSFKYSPNIHSPLPSTILTVAVKSPIIFMGSSNAKRTDIVVISSKSKIVTTVPSKVTKSSTSRLPTFTRNRNSHQVASSRIIGKSNNSQQSSIIRSTRHTQSSQVTVTQVAYSNVNSMTGTTIVRKKSGMKLSNVHTSSQLVTTKVVTGFLLITSDIKMVSRRTKSLRLSSKDVTFKDTKQATLVSLSNSYLISTKSYYSNNFTSSLYQKNSKNSERKLNTPISTKTLKKMSSDIIDSAPPLISVKPSLIFTVMSNYSKISKKATPSRYLGLSSNTFSFALKRSTSKNFSSQHMLSSKSLEPSISFSLSKLEMSSDTMQSIKSSMSELLERSTSIRSSGTLLEPIVAISSYENLSLVRTSMTTSAEFIFVASTYQRSFTLAENRSVKTKLSLTPITVTRNLHKSMIMSSYKSILNVLTHSTGELRIKTTSYYDMKKSSYVTALSSRKASAQLSEVVSVESIHQKSSIAPRKSLSNLNFSMAVTGSFSKEKSLQSFSSLPGVSIKHSLLRISTYYFTSSFVRTSIYYSTSSFEDFVKYTSMITAPLKKSSVQLVTSKSKKTSIPIVTSLSTKISLIDFPSSLMTSGLAVTSASRRISSSMTVVDQNLFSSYSQSSSISKPTQMVSPVQESKKLASVFFLSSARFVSSVTLSPSELVSAKTYIVLSSNIAVNSYSVVVPFSITTNEINKKRSFTAKSTTVNNTLILSFPTLSTAKTGIKRTLARTDVLSEGDTSLKMPQTPLLTFVEITSMATLIEASINTKVNPTSSLSLQATSSVVFITPAPSVCEMECVIKVNTKVEPHVKNNTEKIIETLTNELELFKISGYLSTAFHKLGDSDPDSIELYFNLTFQSETCIGKLKDSVLDKKKILDVEGRFNNTFVAGTFNIKPFQPAKEDKITFKVTIQLTSVNFSVELKNKASARFQQLEEAVREELTILYEQLKGFVEVLLISFEAGSVITNYEIIFDKKESTTKNEKYIESSIKNITRNKLKSGKLGKFNVSSSFNITLSESVIPQKKVKFPGWAIALIVIVILVIIAFIVVATLKVRFCLVYFNLNSVGGFNNT